MKFQLQLRRKLQFCTKHTFVLFVLLLFRPGFAQNWQQWGGPNGNFKVATKGLADKWPDGGPKHLWKRPLGEGYSSILYKDGMLFTLYGEDSSEVIISLDAQTGRTNWEHRYTREFWPEMRQHFGPGPNASPVIIDDRLPWLDN